jgi:phospholipid/cholesterol/gamma-HCH transport system substrate-binding protein
METDKHYFFEGLFILGLLFAAALFLIWLETTGHRDDVTYRIHFAESVSGLGVGDPVQFHGVDIGTVKSMAIDASDPLLVQVDVNLRKDAPIKTDTKATLKMKGITGVVMVELNGGSANAKSLVETTPPGQIPEIPSEKSTLAILLEEMPKLIRKFSSIEDQAKKVVTDIGGTASKIKENPSLLLFKQKDKDKDKDKEKPSADHSSWLH